MAVEVASKWSDHTVSHELVSFFAREDDNTAGLLLRLAEFDARKLYVPAGYPSMFAYCVGKLRRSPDSVNKRIRAARIARQFPATYAAIASGRLCLTAILQLGCYLTDANVDELLAAAAYRSGPEIAQLLAECFPKPDVPTRLAPVTPDGGQLAAQPVEGGVPEPLALEGELAAQPVEARSRVTPCSAERVAVQFTIDRTTHEKLRYVQRLLGHDNPAHELAGVFDRALDALARELEKKKFAATTRPCPRPEHGSTTARYIPAPVRRAVWERDQARCTFVADDGHRCEARTHLEYDHVEPVARGGRSSTANVRLRCRAHNQFEAEQVFGAAFMRHKRERGGEAARRRAVARGAEQFEVEELDAKGSRPRNSAEGDVTLWLRRLGFSEREARAAARSCASLPGASSSSGCAWRCRISARGARCSSAG